MLRQELREWHAEKVKAQYIERRIRAMEITNIVQPDSDEAEWNLISGELLIGGEVRKELLPQESRVLRAAANRAYYKNPHIRGIVDNVVNFIVGTGISIIFENVEGEELEEVKTEWESFEKANKWRRKTKEWSRRSIRDGETFVHYITADENNPTRIHFLEPDTIESKNPKITHGIETQSDDISNIIAYHVINPNDETEDIIRPKDITHTKLGVDENVKRGRSELEVILEDASEYKTFRKVRTILNKARSSILMHLLTHY